jgi:predicted RNA binding protein YcfA (HicA-like mRNA interferase family)
MRAIRPTSYEVQIKVFEAAGCKYSHTRGDHLVYHYPGAIRPVVIPISKPPRHKERQENDSAGSFSERFSPLRKKPTLSVLSALAVQK